MPLIDALLSVIAPHACLVCEAEGKLVCSWCALEAFPAIPSRCYRCQRLTSDFAVCSKCQATSSLAHVWIVTGYTSVAKELIHRFKYARTIAAKVAIANAMSDLLPYLSTDTIVIHVPTATSRVRSRGYDQTELLASSIARQKGLRNVRAVTHLTQARQVGASREQRLKQLANSFMVTKPHTVKNADILLIDDVITTGSTLESIAKLLKRSGAKTINALVFAQKL